MKRRYKVLLGVTGGFAVLLAGAALAISHNSPCTAAVPPAAGTATMRAAVYRCYGPPEVIRVEQVERPTVASGRMLVKVQAASLNPLDWHYLRGEPFIMRAGVGMGAPSLPGLGVDFAGVVTAVGPGVTRFKAGDRVFGGRRGSLAEYVSVAESGAVAALPDEVSFTAAAATPIAALTALQALRDKGGVKPGQHVLINGASGGVGSFAVQFAKWLGAAVTGVCSTGNVPLVKSLGADHVIDYTREDYTRGPESYDLIVDMAGNHSLRDNRRVLKPGGTLVIVGSTSRGRWLGAAALPLKVALAAPFVKERVLFFMAELNQPDLAIVARLLASSTIRAVIDRTYGLGEVPAAMRHLEQGHARGKIVVNVE